MFLILHSVQVVLIRLVWARLNMQNNFLEFIKIKIKGFEAQMSCFFFNRGAEGILNSNFNRDLNYYYNGKYKLLNADLDLFAHIKC